MAAFSFAKMLFCLKIKFSEVNMVSSVFWINDFEGQSWEQLYEHQIKKFVHKNPQANPKSIAWKMLPFKYN